MADKNKGNTKARLSQKWMEEALLQLMKEKSFEDISIQNMTEAAQLSRRTFYRNYDKKEDILLGKLRRICQEYERNLRSASELSFPSITKIFFNTIQKHLEFFLLMNKHHLIDLFIAEIDTFLLPLHQELRGAVLGFDEELSRLALTFSIGGFGRVLILWLNEGAVKTPEELADLTNKAIQRFFISC